MHVGAPSGFGVWQWVQSIGFRRNDNRRGRDGISELRGPPQQVALPVRDAEALDLGLLRFGLDALGDRFRVDPRGEPDEHLDDVPLDGVLVEAGHEVVRDLEVIGPQLGDRLEGRVPGPRVVDRDTETELPQHAHAFAEEVVVADRGPLGDLEDDAALNREKRLQHLVPPGLQLVDELRLHVHEQHPGPLPDEALGRELHADLLKAPYLIRLQRVVEEHLRVLERRLLRAARERLVREDRARREVDDRLVERLDLPADEDVLELLAEKGRSLAFLRRGDRDRLAERPVNEPLEPHLGAVQELRVTDVEADIPLDAVLELLAQRLLQRLLDLLRLALQPLEDLVAPEARRHRKEDVELRARGTVDRDEVLCREQRSEEPLERLRRLAQHVVEDLPAVVVLDVRVLLEVDEENAHLLVHEKPFAKRVHDHGNRRKTRHRVEEQVARPRVSRVLRKERRTPAFPRLEKTFDRLEEVPLREGLRDVVVRADLHPRDEVLDLGLHREHDDRNRGGLGQVLERRADLPSRDLGHRDVQEDHGRLRRDGLLDPLPAVAGEHGGVPRVREQRLHDEENVLVVVDDQDLAFVHEAPILNGELRTPRRRRPAPRSRGSCRAFRRPRG